MAFRIRKDAHSWFKYLRPQLKLDFDEYYYCLIAGLTSRRKVPANEVSLDETKELIQRIPVEYGKSTNLIIALCLYREIGSLGIKINERSSVNAKINELVDPLSQSRLSSEGESLMNRYAHGGFETLTEWFEDQPRTLEIFLPLLKNKIDSEMLKYP